MINIKLSTLTIKPQLNDRGEIDVVYGTPVELNVNEPNRRLPGEDDMVI